MQAQGCVIPLEQAKLKIIEEESIKFEQMYLEEFEENQSYSISKRRIQFNKNEALPI